VARKFYVVWAGRKTGVFTDWTTTHQYVDKYPGAKFKSFSSREEADQAFRAGKPATAPSQRSTLPAASRPSRMPVAAVGLQIYCDGACEPNPGNAGSGIAVYRDGTLAELWYGLYNPNGTNNTAELNALHHAMLIAEPAISSGLSAQILCDSTYSLNCISRWAASWEQKGWRKPGGEIRNLSIIQSAYAVYTSLGPRLQLIHVKGHAGTEGNELADRMAMLAVERQTQELRQYSEEIDVRAILRMRSG